MNTLKPHGVRRRPQWKHGLKMNAIAFGVWILTLGSYLILGRIIGGEGLRKGAVCVTGSVGILILLGSALWLIGIGTTSEERKLRRSPSGMEHAHSVRQRLSLTRMGFSLCALGWAMWAGSVLTTRDWTWMAIMTPMLAIWVSAQTWLADAPGFRSEHTPGQSAAPEADGHEKEGTTPSF